MRGKCLFVSLNCLFVRHNCLFVKHNCLFVRHNRVLVGQVKLRTYLSRNFNLRTSEAHFIKKSALRGTAATCDSLVLSMKIFIFVILKHQTEILGYFTSVEI